MVVEISLLNSGNAIDPELSMCRYFHLVVKTWANA